MAIQLSVAVRNAILDVYESTIGTAPKLQLRTGSVPANCAAANTGTLASTLTLPSDWMAAASSGSKALAGSWTGTGAASGPHTLAHYRLFESTETTCHEQGTVTVTGGGGDLTVDNTSLATGQTINITTWTRTAGNA